MKTMFIALAAAGAVLAGAPAAAEQVTIQHRDLDLSTERGQKVLEQRIDRAAREVCGLGGLRTGTRLSDRDAQRCYAEAKSKSQRAFAALVAKSGHGG